MFRSPKIAVLVIGMVATISAYPLIVWGQAGSDEDPLQEGIAVPGAQTQDELLGGAFGISSSGEVRGFIIPAKRRAGFDFAAPGEIKFQDRNGEKAVTAGTPASAHSHKSYVKSNGGRFVAVVTRDLDKKATSTDVYDLDAKRVASLSRPVVALSGNARFAVLSGASQVAEVASGKTISLDLPADGVDRNIQMAEDSDAFVSSYRRGKDAFVAAFAKDGSLMWRKPAATGVSPFVRNTVFSSAGDHVAVVAGELPIDHLTLYDSSGQAVWKKQMPPGNYAMSFTADGSKLFLIHRDGQVLYKVSDGAMLWEKSFPLAAINEKGTLIATKVLVGGRKFVVASRSVLSTEPGKRPHETTSRISGPDLIYTIDESGRVDLILNRPSGAFLTEAGRFHYEPVVTLGGNPIKVYYLTKGGLRAKSIR